SGNTSKVIPPGGMTTITTRAGCQPTDNHSFVTNLIPFGYHFLVRTEYGSGKLRRGGNSMVAVTGATGHLGNVLVRELLSRNVPVRAVIPKGEDTTPLNGLKVEKVEGNVLDPGSLVGAFQGADVVYHMAGILFTSPRRTKLMYDVNLGGTRNVAEA